MSDFLEVLVKFTKFFIYRTRHLLCKQQICNQVPIAHIGYIHYTHYRFEVNFYNLETFHQKYQVKEVLFFVSVFKLFVDMYYGRHYEIIK